MEIVRNFFSWLASFWTYPLDNFQLPPPASNNTTVIRRIGFGSCLEQDRPQPIWDRISALRPDLFLLIGDNIYADTEDMDEMARKYQQLGSQPEFSRFRAHRPVLATWDDHDYGINDGGAEYKKKEESKKIMLDFFGEPSDSARRLRPGIYTSYTIGPRGKRLQIILLDLRWFRSALLQDKDTGAYVPNPDPNAILLGPEQWAWLEEELKQPADLRIVASSTQFVSSEHNWEKWANFPLDKKRMLDLIDRLGLTNVLFVSGDMHYGELSEEATPKGIRICDLTSSGMNLVEPGRQFPNKNRLAIHDTSPNFGFIEIDWYSRIVGLQVRDENGLTSIRKDIAF